MDEIIVKTKDIRKVAFNIEKLSRNVHNRSVKFPLNCSAGETAEALKSLEKDLQKLGFTISQVMEDTANDLKLTANTFEEMDNNIAETIKR